MKKTFTLLFLLSATLAAKALNYIPFPTRNAMWTQREGQGDTTPLFHCYGITTQDTLINSVSYHLLYKSVDTVLDATETIGGLREDNKRIYYLAFGQSQERMLYDFNLQVGDTSNVGMGPEGVVSSIDSVLIGTVWHRRFNFVTLSGNQWPFGAWIEGIGNSSLGGLFASPMAQPTCDCAQNIICFKQGNDWIYHNPAYSTFDCVTAAVSVPTLLPSYASVKVYPNPVTGAAHISIQGAAGNLRIYNMTGAILHSYKVNDGDNISIDKVGYATGMYYYTFGTGAGNTLSGKFVVE